MLDAEHLEYLRGEQVTDALVQKQPPAIAQQCPGLAALLHRRLPAATKGSCRYRWGRGSAAYRAC
ncbi:hypothetical protein AB672_02640 [Xylella taiwanensis]|nr:hypothetical protein AB672_02640 [Xylella taiwanensis]